jgi:hypothetical protein
MELADLQIKLLREALRLACMDCGTVRMGYEPWEDKFLYYLNMAKEKEDNGQIDETSTQLRSDTTA